MILICTKEENLYYFEFFEFSKIFQKMTNQIRTQIRNRIKKNKAIQVK